MTVLHYKFDAWSNSAPHLERRTLILSPTLDAAAPATVTIPVMESNKETTSEALLSLIVSSLEDDKAEDIVQIDLRGKTTIGDYMVIASGRSSRQVSSISEKLTDRLKAHFGVLCNTEGKDTGDWVLIDSGDVIVHVFRPEVREFYQLEKMWLPTGTVSQ